MALGNSAHVCRHCAHSLSQWVDGEPRLMCLWHRRLASQACDDWVREPGSDDDKADDGDKFAHG
jgi:hypothetical protein